MSFVRQPATPSADVGTLVPLEPPPVTGLALYVLGDENGARYPLPAAGSVTIGRDATCEIVLDHPMVSRRHLTLHLGAELQVEDLRSANGTTLDKQRLQPGALQPLEVEQSFFIGSIALVVHQHRFPTLTSRGLVTPTELMEKIELNPTPFGLAKVTMSRPVEARWIETILAAALASHDLIVPIRATEIAVYRPDADLETMRDLADACGKAMARWQVPAQGVATTFTELGSREAVAQFLLGPRTLETSRGSVILGDPAMADLHRVVERVAPTGVNVLISGETGVGKDVFASLLHERSPRRNRPLLKINCATLSETLLETELFGHERGAFTGAVTAKEGLLESADGGTVFLDELAEMPLSVQAKLLRVIENREVTRLGGLKSKAIDVRFIAASNRDLEHAITQGTFRRDLFYRLDTVPIRVPPLRERPSEIGPLALHFLGEACRAFGLQQVTLSPAAIDALKAYSWPGNIRQLRNVIERSALLVRDPVLKPEDLGLPHAGAAPGTAGPTTSENAPTAPTAKRGEDHQGDGDGEAGDDDDETERKRIIDALNACGGNQSRAATMLKMPRRTLVRKLGRYGLPRPRDPGAGGTL